MKFKIKYADQIVGLFIVISLVVFGMIIILLGINQRWFSKNYYFKAVFTSSANLSEGTSIYMKGFPIGKIRRVSLNEANMVDVDFYIFDDYYDKVMEYSLLELSVSPIGLGTQLLFHPGLGSSRLDEGAQIYTVDSIDGQIIIDQELVSIPPKDDSITRLLASAGPVMESANRLMTTLNRTMTLVYQAMAGQNTGPLGTVFEDVAATTGRLPGMMDNVDAIVADVQARTASLLALLEAVLEETAATLGHVSGITGNLEATSEELRDPTGLVPRLLAPQGSLKTILDDDDVLFNRLIVIIDDVGKAVRSLQQIVSSLNSEVPKIASVLNETKIAIEKAQDVLEGVKNNPLIRGGVPERAAQETLYNSMREGSFD